MICVSVCRKLIKEKSFKGRVGHSHNNLHMLYKLVKEPICVAGIEIWYRNAYLESLCSTSRSGTHKRSIDGAPLVPSGTPFRKVVHITAYRSGRSDLPRTCSRHHVRT